MEVRDPLEPQPGAELTADEDHRVLERRERFGSLVVAPDDAHPDLGMPKVRRGLDLGDGGEADPGIGHLALEHRPDLLAQEFVEAVGSLGHRSVGRSVGRSRRASQPAAARLTVWLE